MAGERPQDAVVKEVRIRASPETVFAFFTDPAKMVLWKGVDAMLDPRPGGAYRVNVTGRDVVLGEYLEVVPYSRVVFTWGWENETIPLPPGSSTVEVTLTPDGPYTIVRLRHSGLSPEMAEEHARGWDHYLARLLEAAEGRDAGPDPNVMGQRPGRSG
ncbi:MAG TPA: SRPBCC domain-containing protein [Dehalococcoidia bacterium]|nr:SRPBCC domain-containing protein [Dehalococcoidia bacterium]